MLEEGTRKDVGRGECTTELSEVTRVAMSGKFIARLAMMKTLQRVAVRMGCLTRLPPAHRPPDGPEHGERSCKNDLRSGGKADIARLEEGPVGLRDSIRGENSRPGHMTLREFCGGPCSTVVICGAIVARGARSSHCYRLHLCNQGVAGSSPAAGTIDFKDLSHCSSPVLSRETLQRTTSIPQDRRQTQSLLLGAIDGGGVTRVRVTPNA